MNLLDPTLVGAAGSVGAISRYLLDGAVRQRRPGPFPLGTVAVNVSGSLVFGLLAGLVVFQAIPSRFSLIGGTGFCGGYTTFSTASFETVRLAQEGLHRAALLNVMVTVTGTLVAGAVGLTLAFFV